MSDPASDPRPRPQYGEYATPEEQRAHIREPAPDWEPLAPAEPPAPAGPLSHPSEPPTASPPATLFPVAAAPTSRGRTIDRFVTIALLVYGLFNVITSVPAFLDYPAYADLLFGVMGVDAELTDPTAARPWGVAAAVVLAVGWMLVAWLSLRSLRRGRITWWVPLAGGVVFVFVSGILMIVPLMTDPGVWDVLVGSLDPAG